MNDDEAVADAFRLRCDYASVEHDCARLITAIREDPDTADLRALANELEAHGRPGWVAKTLAQRVAVGRDTHALCDRTITEQRATIERLTKRDAAHRSWMRALGEIAEVDVWRAALGALDGETTLDAIKRVRSDEAGGSYREAWDALLVQQEPGEPIVDVVPRLVREATYERERERRADGAIAAAIAAAVKERDAALADAAVARAERDDARALMEGALDEQARLDRRAKTAEHGRAVECTQKAMAYGVIALARDERDAAIAERDAARRELAELENVTLCGIAAEHRADAALERCGYYERSNTPRLLGIAPDQLARVQAILAAAEAWEGAVPGCIPALSREVVAWIAAGRPLAGEVE